MIAERTGVAAVFVRWEGMYQVPDGIDLVVNANSIGLFPNITAQVPLDVTTLLPGMVVCDVIPNPPRTRLIRAAEDQGCTVLDGLGMLVNQGVIGLRLWSGREPDPEVMRKALEDVFS
jgi:shikimate dehydrogenase